MSNTATSKFCDVLDLIYLLKLSIRVNAVEYLCSLFVVVQVTILTSTTSMSNAPNSCNSHKSNAKQFLHILRMH